MTGKTVYEGQVSHDGGLFLLTVTISHMGQYHTSNPVPLMARDWDAATDEADVVLRNLARACNGGSGDVR